MKYKYPGACGDIGHCAIRLHTNTLPLELQPLPLDQFQTETRKTWNHSKRRGTLHQSPVFLGRNYRRPPPRIIFKLFEGVFLPPSNNVIKYHGKSSKYSDHSHYAIVKSDPVFVALQSYQLMACAVVLYYCLKYRGQPCEDHGGEAAFAVRLKAIRVQD